MRDALGETPAALRHPCRHRPGCGWKGRAFADPERKPRGEQARKSADDTVCCSCPTHDQAADEQRPPWTEFVSDVASDQLEQRIRIGECRKGPAEVGVAEVVVRMYEVR